MSTKLRIGLVCPYSFNAHGGVQNHVLGLARFLRAAGHDANILAPGEPGPETGIDPNSFTSAGSAVGVPYNGSVARVNFGPTSAARVRRWLRDGNFDLVHIHEPVVPSISLLALWATQAPVVATFHAATPRSRSMQLAGDLFRTLINKVVVHIAVSESARSVVVQYHGSEPRVIPNGFSFSQFGDRHDLERGGRRWRAGGRPRLTFLGRADERRKGLSVLLDALPMIMRQYPELEVAIAGEGAGQLPAACRRLGALPDRGKARLLRATDVFVAPQLERESFGIVLLEAMASSAPVVASDLDPFLGLLQPRGTEPLGEIFPRGDSKALAEAALRVLRKPDTVRTERARLASQRYDWAVVGPQVLTAYQAAFADRRPPAEKTQPVCSAMLDSVAEASLHVKQGNYYARPASAAPTPR